jgi:hypothetical protein
MPMYTDRIVSLVFLSKVVLNRGISFFSIKPHSTVVNRFWDACHTMKYLELCTYTFVNVHAVGW